MPSNQFVVLDPNTKLYLIAYNSGSPSDSLFGNLSSAIIYERLEDAQAAAASIGGGTVGTPKKP